MTKGVIDGLFAKTLLGGYDDDAPWAAVHELQALGTREVLNKAAGWCRSVKPLKRARGADVLSQLGRAQDRPENIYSEESFAIISSLIQTEKESRPLSSAIYALGHIGNPQAVRILSRYQNHSDAEIRFALAFAFGNFPDNDTAVDVLVRLTRDEDEDVRDWATFGIGALGKRDSVGIRDALISRLDDSFEDVRQEAIVGLARLGDKRVLSALLIGLEQHEVPEIIVEAALCMLDITEGAQAWTPARCVAELRRRFGCETIRGPRVTPET